jgi:DnaJ-class molecular chaperone
VYTPNATPTTAAYLRCSSCSGTGNTTCYSCGGRGTSSV